MSKKNEKDQYYTNSSYAVECYSMLIKVMNDHGFNDSAMHFFEPCAGTGSFFLLMPENNRTGMDLEPKCSGNGMNITPQDFLKYKGRMENGVVLSNPPFGKNSSLAVKFFYHCASLGAEIIAFVIPRTFRKDSIKNKLIAPNVKGLSFGYELIHDETTPDNSFTLGEDGAYDVSCCFQIWKRVKSRGNKTQRTHDNDYFSFCKKSEEPDFSVRRVGGKAGKLLDGFDHKEPSTYFIKSKINELDLLKNALLNLDLSEQASNTVGMLSVTKFDISDGVIEYIKGTGIESTSKVTSNLNFLS